METLGNTWDKVLQDEFNKEYFVKLRSFIKNEYQNYTIYPPKEQIFNAFKMTDFNNVKVVILGQDPYHGPRQSHGLCFSVQEGVKIPPSLRNIYKEISNDLGITFSNSGNLTKWAKQGVLLLNTVLTVQAGKAKSHQKKGWEIFTDQVIELLNNSYNTIVFLLWGNDAKSKTRLITNPNHYILTAPHPSPLSAYGGFFGCRHFSKVNKILKEKNMKEINWKI